MGALRKTAAIGTLVSMVALAVSLLLPALMGPGISWDEAKLGYIPAGAAFLIFNALFVISSTTAAAQQTGETSVPTGTWRRALAHVVATGSVIAGGVGAAFCAAQAWECSQIAETETLRQQQLQKQVAEFDVATIPDGDSELEKLKQELQWCEPEIYRQEFRFFRGWGLASGGAAAVGLTWLAFAFFTRGRSRAGAA